MTARAPCARKAGNEHLPIWSPQQDEALKAAAAWLKDVGADGGRRRLNQQIFRLFGYAGTGKTLLARHLAEHVDGEVAFAAFTGKAASMLRRRGADGATTIHSLIYRPRGGEEDEPSFVINRDSAAATARLIIIDECSMVDEDLGRDLLSFGVPVLVLGDPAQLPPVKGGGFFTDHEPDIMLTEVHRQARDNPIIEMSMRIRDGEGLGRGQYGESRVIGRKELKAEDALSADQVLVGRNASRRAYNTRMRQLIGRWDWRPAAGDKLVCLRNNRKKGLLNGGLWIVKEVGTPKRNLFSLRLAPEEKPDGKAVAVSVPPQYFDPEAEGSGLSGASRAGDAFDYGYALTVHKAQGSQWEDVLLLDESFAFPEYRARWLYTGLTRAERRVTVAV